MKKPTTSLQEVLFELITEGKCSINQFFYLAGFRTRISELKGKYDLRLNSSEKGFGVNKHDNKYTFPIHRLLPEHRNKAINLYNTLQS